MKHLNGSFAQKELVQRKRGSRTKLLASDSPEERQMKLRKLADQAVKEVERAKARREKAKAKKDAELAEFSPWVRS